jgi:hypothetical protein
MEVGKDGLLGPRPHARAVEIVEAQQPEAIAAAGFQPTEQGRAEVAQMKRTTGRRREAPPHPLLAQGQALFKTVSQTGWQGHQDHR